MRFSKWHALGNSYIVVARQDAGELTAALARRLCDIGTGVGAHGVVEVVATDGPHAEVVIWNPDGSTAEMSGNGTRIAAAWLASQIGADAITIAVAGRQVLAAALGDGRFETSVGAVDVGQLELIDVTGPAPVEHRGEVPPRAVVVPGTRPKVFPAGTYELDCALIVGWRQESHDLRLSLNDVLREFEIAV